MNLNLKGSVAIVTGSSRGIGFEIARQMGLAGARVAICARDPDELKTAAANLHKLDIETKTFSLDLVNKEAAGILVNDVIRTWGQLDILVNNVGGLPQTGNFLTLDDESWLESFNLNIMTMVRFSREAIPHLRKSKNPRILNVSSFVAKQPGKMNPHYSVVKAGVLNLTKHLAGFLANDQILVNSISPGIIHTEGWDDYIQTKSAEEKRELAEVEAAENKRATQSVPLGRLGRPEEVAALAVYLCSPQASFTTGADYMIDGGKRMTI